MKGLTKKVPTILYCKGSSVFAPELATINPSAISLDWNADLNYVRGYVPKTIALQGNLDPDVLYAPTAVIEHEVTKMLNSRRGDPSYIFNLGHGIRPDMPYGNIRTLVDTVQGFV